jgi:hypothetical protein
VTDDDNSEMELYGVSPWVIGFFIFIISLITPLGFVLSNGTLIALTAWYGAPFIYGLLWVFEWSYYGHFYFSSIRFLDLSLMWMLIPLSIFSILYIRQIIRYYFGKSSRDSAVMVGILSIIFPSLVWLLTSSSLALLLGTYDFALIIPIPIQFIAGLILLRKFEGPEVISPWPGQYIDWSWWARLKAKWSNRAVDIIEIHLEEEREDIEWLESE